MVCIRNIIFVVPHNSKMYTLFILNVQTSGIVKRVSHAGYWEMFKWSRTSRLKRTTKSYDVKTFQGLLKDKLFRLYTNTKKIYWRDLVVGRNFTIEETQENPWWEIKKKRSMSKSKNKIPG